MSFYSRMRFSLFALSSPFLASISKKSDSKVTVVDFEKGGGGLFMSLKPDILLSICPQEKISTMAKLG